MPQSDSPDGPPTGDPTVVGIVRNHYYKKRAIGVEVAEGQRIPKGSTLLGLGIPQRWATLRADSIQLDHVDVDAGESGQEIGIGMDPPFLPKGTKLVFA